ncbi:serine protease [Rhodococcus sp. NPDC058514]|uniref:serine protease n=1 Tax=Rhodococcus sp. NPDC058514 TaxID=3346532 RepID=UPI003669E4A8
MVGQFQTCTLTTIGHDDNRRLVGLTSGHCGDVGDDIQLAEHPTTSEVVGKVVSENPGLDFAVIEFDSSLAAPKPNSRLDTGPDPSAGEEVCKRSRAGKLDCGTVLGLLEQTPITLNRTCSMPGDSGAPVFADGRLVGMNAGTHGEPGRAPSRDSPCGDQPVDSRNPAYTFSISDVLDALRKSGNVGSGLIPEA